MSSPNGFQNQVNLNPAPAVAGDFASANPRTAVLAGPGGFVAGAAGVVVGKFAWIEPFTSETTGLTQATIVQSFGTNGATPDGFVARNQQALIENYLQSNSNVVPGGFPVTLHNNGDFWALVTGSTAATKGAQVYANNATGDIVFGSAPTGASVTASMGSTSTGAMGSTSTGTAVSGNALEIDITSVTGLLSIGETISGTGITAGTTIVSQVSGTTGGAGRYLLSATNTASSATITTFGNVYKASAVTGLISVGETISGGSGFPVGATVTSQVSGTAGGAGVYTLSAPATAYVASASGVTTFGNVLDVTAVGSGTLNIGDGVSGTGIPSNAAIASLVSGSGGAQAGVYTLTQNASAYAASTTVTATGGVSATGWFAQSAAAVGELVKISTW